MDKAQITAALVEYFNLIDRIKDEGHRLYLMERKQLLENRLRKEVGVEINRP